MMKLKHGIGLVAIGSVAFLAGRMIPAGDSALAAQPDKKPAATQPDKKPAAPTTQPDKKPAAQPDKKPAGEMGQMAKPGPEHKRLDVFLGDFEGGVKFWMAPNTEAQTSGGKIHREAAMGGFFVIEHVTGDPMGPGAPAFMGTGVLGYNQHEKQYQFAWFDNSDSAITTAMGTYDEKTKTFTYTGDEYDMMTGKKVKNRTMIDVSNPDHQVMTGYRAGPDGKEFKSFEGTFDRKKK